MKQFFFCLCIVIMSGGCKTSKNISGENPTLYQKWNLIYLNGDSIAVAKERPVYIEFHDSANRVTGSGGCNRFFSSFTVEKNNLQIKPVASTKMACMDSTRSRIENNFFQMLNLANAYSFKDGKLLLQQDQKVIAAFEASHAIPDQLAGRWELYSIHDTKTKFNDLYSDKKPFIVFTDGQAEFSGNTSCNSFTGEFLSTKNTALFKPGVMTMMACPGKGEQAFLNRFKKVNSYRILNDTLVFYYNKKPLLKFAKQTSYSLQ